MTTSILSPPPVRPRSFVSRVVKTLLGLLALAAIAFCLYVYSVARAALPQLDGTIKLSALSAPVKVTRDLHGVPTIDAANLPVLFFAHGYLTVQHLLFQLTCLRPS